MISERLPILTEKFERGVGRLYCGGYICCTLAPKVMTDEYTYENQG